MQLRVGFIGLGIMGRPMVKNLLKAGFGVTVWNRSWNHVDALLAAGAKKAGSPAEVAGASDVVITIVGDSPDVEQVVLGPNGVLEGAHPGLVVIDMTTISPEVTRHIAAECAAKGVDMLDAPVSGGEKGAIEATLSIMVGGKAEVLDRCRPVLQCLGASIVHVGDHGTGQTVKLCNQIIGGLNLLAVAEGLALAAKAGVDPSVAIEVITKGAAGSWSLANLGPKMVAGNYAPGFMVKFQLKDLRLAMETASGLDLPLPGTALVQQLFRSLVADGAGDEGTQALVKVIERLGNTRVAQTE